MTWDYDDDAFKKQAEADPIWYLERLINYGLKGSKLSRKLLEKYLPELNIDEDSRAFLELLVWNKHF
jgi:hypothetical protein